MHCAATEKPCALWLIVGPSSLVGYLPAALCSQPSKMRQAGNTHCGYEPLILGSSGCVYALLQVREVVHSRLPISNSEQLQQLPLLHTWGAAAAADAPQQPEGWTLMPSGVTDDTRVTLQQAAAWGIQVQSPFSWQQARCLDQARLQQLADEGAQGQAPDSGRSWADMQVRLCLQVCSQSAHTTVLQDGQGAISCPLHCNAVCWR
jgi:hypothetical protein